MHLYDKTGGRCSAITALGYFPTCRINHTRVKNQCDEKQILNDNRWLFMRDEHLPSKAYHKYLYPTVQIPRHTLFYCYLFNFGNKNVSHSLMISQPKWSFRIMGKITICSLGLYTTAAHSMISWNGVSYFTFLASTSTVCPQLTHTFFIPVQHQHFEIRCTLHNFRMSLDSRERSRFTLLVSI